jgi:hypothetical protein
MKIKISKEELERMYIEKHMTTGYISFAKGLTSKTVIEHLKYYNIPRRNKTEKWRNGAYGYKI